MFCIFGCGHQISSISIDYFQYDTVTSMVMEMPNLILAPSLSICVHYADILNYEGVKFKDNERMNVFTFEKYFTVKQILDRVPSADRGFFEYCIYRYPMSFVVKGYMDDECYKIFHIDKFFILVS